MLGDTYIDDEPPDLKVPSEISAHLLMTPQFPTTQYPYTTGTTLEFQTSRPPEKPNQDKITSWGSTFNPTTEKKSEKYQSKDEEPKLSYKAHSSKYAPTEYEHGFRAWNSLTYKDRDLEQKEFFKDMARKKKSQKINQEELEQLISHAIDDGDDTEEGSSGDGIDDATKTSSSSSTPSWLQMNKTIETGSTIGQMQRSKRLKESNNNGSGESTSNFDSGNEDAVKNHPWGLVFTVIGTVLLDFDADACQSPSRAYMLDVTIPGKYNKEYVLFSRMPSWRKLSIVKCVELTSACLACFSISYHPKCFSTQNTECCKILALLIMAYLFI